MKFLHPYKDDPCMSGKLGQWELYKLEAAAEKTDVKSCPCCGSDAALGVMFAYTEPAVFIQCPSCHIKTVPYIAGFDLVQRREISLTERFYQAAEVWNKRV